MHLYLNIPNVEEHFFSQFVNCNPSLFLNIFQFASMFVSRVFKLALEILLLFLEFFGVQKPILNIFQLLSSFGDFSFFVIMLNNKISVDLSEIFIV